jgi:hypothetical protein
MSPLLVTRHLGKIVYSLLIYFQPRPNMNLLANKSPVLVN